MPYDISEEKRDWYREVSARSRSRKAAARRGELCSSRAEPNLPAFRPELLMPERQWPNGVQGSLEAAVRFPPENGHFRLSVQDCGLRQGFPEDWRLKGAVYQAIGQIGNSVCPPVGYAVANSIADALRA